MSSVTGSLHKDSDTSQLLPIHNGERRKRKKKNQKKNGKSKSTSSSSKRQRNSGDRSENSDTDYPGVSAKAHSTIGSDVAESVLGGTYPVTSNSTSSLLHPWNPLKAGSDLDLRFVDVNLQAAIEQSALFDAHPVIKACERLRLQHLTSGGVVIERPFLKMNTQCRHWFDNVYADLTHCLVRTWSRFGFAVVVILPHKKMIGEPKVLDMAAIRVQMAVDFCGVRRYRVYRRDVSSGFSPTGEEVNITDQCLVFEKDPPNRDGTCNGELSCLATDLMHFEYMRNIHLQAAKGAALPLVFIQQRNNKNADQSADLCAPTGLTFPLAAETGQDKDGVGVIALAPHQARIKDWAVRICEAKNNNVPWAPSQPLVEIGTDGKQAWKLEDNQEVATGPNVANVTDFANAVIFLEERISTVMGVPRQLYAVSGYSHNTDSAQVNSMFQFNQDSLKREVVRVLYDVYQEIYASINLEEASQALADTEWKENAQKLLYQAGVSINLPGIPDAVQMQNFYAQGLITWDYYVRWASNMMCIPESCFNRKPPLTIQETNGIKEPTTTSSSSSSKKTPKKKAK